MNDNVQRHERADIETKVNIEFEKFSGFLQEYSGNVSAGGMFIKTNEIKAVGTVFSFEFKLKGDFTLIHGFAEVRWVREKPTADGQPAGMGVKFVDLDSSGKELINKIISNQKTAVRDQTVPPEAGEQEEVKLSSPWAESDENRPTSPWSPEEEKAAEEIAASDEQSSATTTEANNNDNTTAPLAENPGDGGLLPEENSGEAAMDDSFPSDIPELDLPELNLTETPAEPAASTEVAAATDNPPATNPDEPSLAETVLSAESFTEEVAKAEPVSREAAATASASETADAAKSFADEVLNMSASEAEVKTDPEIVQQNNDGKTEVIQDPMLTAETNKASINTLINTELDSSVSKGDKGVDKEEELEELEADGEILEDDRKELEGTTKTAKIALLAAIVILLVIVFVFRKPLTAKLKDYYFSIKLMINNEPPEIAENAQEVAPDQDPARLALKNSEEDITLEEPAIAEAAPTSELTAEQQEQPAAAAKEEPAEQKMQLDELPPATKQIKQLSFSKPANALSKIENLSKNQTTVIALVGNGELNQDRIEVIEVQALPPRLVVKINNMQKAYQPNKIKINNSPLLKGIRSGYHPDKTLHIVFDLKGREIPNYTLSEDNNKIIIQFGQ